MFSFHYSRMLLYVNLTLSRAFAAVDSTGSLSSLDGFQIFRMWCLDAFIHPHFLRHLYSHASFHFAEKIGINSHCAFYFQKQVSNFNSWPASSMCRGQLKIEREKKLFLKNFFCHFYITSLQELFFFFFHSSPFQWNWNQNMLMWFPVGVCKWHKNLVIVWLLYVIRQILVHSSANVAPNASELADISDWVPTINYQCSNLRTS